MGLSADAGTALLDLAARAGATSIAVVGTGKNVGKTVTVRAVCDALHRAGRTFGLTSIGRDGEAIDAADAQPKPRLFLYPQTILATARDVLPVSPAIELLDFSDLPTAAGPVVYARVRQAAYFEIAGAPTASGIRISIERLYDLGAQFVVLDGAVDRVAALAGSKHAVVVAAGASNVTTQSEAVDAARALAGRLRIPRYDSAEPFVRIEGALAADEAARLLRERESRQVVVRDPTQIALRGKAYLEIAHRLRLRCERPLHVIAVTVASIGRERYFEPREFLNTVADATGLPAFDIYAEKMAAA